MQLDDVLSELGPKQIRNEDSDIRLLPAAKVVGEGEPSFLAQAITLIGRLALVDSALLANRRKSQRQDLPAETVCEAPCLGIRARHSMHTYPFSGLL